MTYSVDPNAKNVWIRDNANTMDLSVQTDASSVYLKNGRTLEQELGAGKQSLLPTLEYSTTINRTGQIQSIANTVQKQEKQIIKLEQMLISNIVDLDYNNTLLTLSLEIDGVI